MNICILPFAGNSYTPFRPEAEIYVDLAKKGFNITMMIDTDLDYISMFRIAGIKIIPFKTNKKISIKAIKLIRKVIDEEKIDIIYATYSRYISNAAFACIGKKVKMVAYRGTTGGLYPYDPSSYLGILHPRIDGVICVSESVKKHVIARVSKKTRPFTAAIYKGHDLNWYTKPPTPLNQFGSAPGNFNVACIASERPHKGLIYLLKSAAILAPLKNIHILLIGNRIEQKLYLEAIEKSGMQERIHMTGYREDAPEIIASCDVLVLPSFRKEGLPRVLLESLSYGTPAVVAANPSSMEVIEDNVNGYVVPIKNHQAIADKIEFLSKNPETLKSLSNNCQNTIESKFSHKQTVEEFARYFYSLSP